MDEQCTFKYKIHKSLLTVSRFCFTPVGGNSSTDSHLHQSQCIGTVQ